MVPPSSRCSRGMVAGVEVTSEAISSELARRRLGYGRGARHEVRGRQGHHHRRCPPRIYARWPRGHRDRQHRVAQVGNHHVRRPGRPGPARRSGSQCPVDAPASRTRRLQRHAQVRLQRRASRPRARQRSRDRSPRGRWNRRTVLPASGIRCRGRFTRYFHRCFRAVRRTRAGGQGSRRDRREPRSAHSTRLQKSR